MAEKKNLRTQTTPKHLEFAKEIDAAARLIKSEKDKISVEKASEIKNLMQPEKYCEFRENYRELIIQAWKLKNDNFLKISAMAFMDAVLKRDEPVDISVIFFMLCNTISEETEYIVCTYADKIGQAYIGTLIYQRLTTLLAQGYRFDVLKKAEVPFEDGEIDRIKRIVAAYKKFAKDLN